MYIPGKYYQILKQRSRHYDDSRILFIYEYYREGALKDSKYALDAMIEYHRPGFAVWAEGGGN